MTYLDYEPGQWTVPSQLTLSRLEALKNDASVEDIQLFLRPLSSMTEEEFNAIAPSLSSDIVLAYRQPKNFTDRPWHVIILENRLHTNTLTFNDGMVLLSRHFDLFGLIESGQALDATTFPNQTAPEL
jgi:acyl-homoserine lactone acylase PvdQ